MSAETLVQILLTVALVSITLWYTVHTARIADQSETATEHAEKAATAAAESAQHAREAVVTAGLSLAAQTAPVVTVATCEIRTMPGQSARLAYRLSNIGNGPALALKLQVHSRHTNETVDVVSAPLSVGSDSVHPPLGEPEWLYPLPESFEAERKQLTVTVDATDVLGNRWRTVTELASGEITVQNLGKPGLAL